MKAAIGKYKVGQKIAVSVKRGNQHIALVFEMMTKEQCEKLPPYSEKPVTPKKKRAWIGISLDTTYQGTGIKINVDPEGPAFGIGLKDDDVVISINGEPIKSRDDFAEFWKKVKVDDELKIVVLRGTLKKTFEMKAFAQPDRENYKLPPKRDPAIPGLPQLPGGLDIQTRRRIGNLNKLAIEAMQIKDYDEAVEYLEKILKLDPNSNIAFYNLACIFSLQDKKEKALKYLKKSIVAGFIDFDHITTDTDLNNLHKMPEYIKMLADKKSMLKMMAQSRVAIIKKEFGETFNTYIDMDSMLILATEHPKEILEVMKEKLVKYAKAQWKSLFDNKPDYFITIIVPSQKKFRELIPNRAIGGFYSPMERTLLASELGFTLTHEFTHALHFADLDKRGGMFHQPWFTEGIATCFENSYLKDGVPTPIHNERLYVLQIALGIVTHPTYKPKMLKLSTMMKINHNQFMQVAGMAYSQARYFTYWMWEQGKLKEYYDLYCKTFARDRSGITAATILFKKSIDEIEKDWLKWVKALPEYKGFTGANRPFIGIRMQEVLGGIEIIEAIAEYPAAKAGLEKGDIITHLDGERILSISDLINFLMVHKIGDVVKITVTRGKEKKTVSLKLVERPKDK